MHKNAAYRIVACCLILCAVSATATAKTIELTKADTGKNIKAAVGDKIDLTLAGNPTTGYSWSIVKTAGDSVKPGKLEYKQRSAARGMVGVGGHYSLAMTVVKTGGFSMTLHYQRPWMKGKQAPASVFHLKVNGSASSPAKPAVFGATETFLLWPGTPPGAKDGDDAKAAATAKAIKDGTYKIPGGNRRGIRVPAIDVYLPPKAKQTGTTMVIYCGGGYGAVCIGSEGIPMAKWLNAHGIAVFMVSYRCSPYRHPIPHWDVQRAIRLVRSRAKEFGVKTNRIGIMGFSAGGHVTATLSVHYNETFGRKPIDDIDKVSARADFSCLIYPVISMRKEITHGGSRRNLLGNNPAEELVVKLSNDEQVDKNTPPAFLAHAKTDRVVKFINSQRYHEACRKNGVPSKYILMSAGRHGPGLKDGKPMISRSDEDYAKAMIEWIKEIVKE
ncbi:MAG: protease inhibitor I42 family protein [Phycisphaerae bacterium]|nr:protease inhibitor I42 family protein [Phycisphaerae bacterium]